MNDVPELTITDQSAGDIIADLHSGKISVPVWLCFRRTRHRITPENKDGVLMGLLIALEIQTRGL